MTYRDTRGLSIPAARSRDAYEVRLLMRFEADGPVDAVEQFIDSIVEFGLRGFVYRATNTETRDSVLVQEREVVTEEEVLARADGLDDEDDEDWP